MKRLAAIIAFALIASCAAPKEEAAPTAGAPSRLIPHGETGGMCGGFAGFQCKSESDYCKFETGVCKNVADASGVCTLKPQVCTMDYRPVCGCDGKTYSNACAAASKGVSIAANGECPKAE